GERMGPRAHHADLASRGCVGDLVEGAAEVGQRLVNGPAHAGDDLDARLEQLVLRLRMLTAMRRTELTEDVAGDAGPLPAPQVEELELPLDAQARPRRRRERDLHKSEGTREAGSADGWRAGRRTCTREAGSF